MFVDMAVAGSGGEPSGEWVEDLVLEALDPLPGVCDLEVGIDRVSLALGRL